MQGGDRGAHALRAGVLWAGLLAEAALAQTQAQTPTPPTPQFQDLQPARAPATGGDAANLPAAPRIPRELARPADELRLDVTRFEIDGAPAALQQALPRLTAAFTGPGRRYEDLIDASDEVTRFLQRELGWYLGFAYLPEQKPQGGVIRLAVLEGRLDEVVLNWADGLMVDRAVVEGYLAALKPGAILTVREVERVVFLVNDLRGLSARFELREGRQWGTASIVVTPKADARWTRRADVDIDGSRFSGVGRVGVQVGWNSPAGRGDGLTGSLLASTTGGLRFGLLGYTTPVGFDGLKLGASVSAFGYRFDRELLPIGLSGRALSFTGYGLYPLVRSRNLNLFSVLSYEHKHFDDREAATITQVKKRSGELRVGITGDFRDNLFTGGVSTYDLNLTGGRVRYDTARSAFNDDDERFGKIGYGVTRLQNLVTNQLLLYVALRGQVGLNNLDSSQQFRLGGPDGVRAFAPGERNGDSGLLATLELRWLPPESVFGRLARELVLSAFVDHGQVRLRHDPATQLARNPNFRNTASLAGAGVGLAWERPGDFVLRVHLAEPTRGTATGDTVERHPRVYAEFSKSF